MEAGFADWFAGFVDGEGCFQLNLTKANPGNPLMMMRPMFKIGQRDDDAQVIFYCREQLGYGNISSRGKQRTFGRNQEYTSQPQTWLEVSSKKDFVPFCNLLDERLRSKKAEDFLVWKEAIQYGMENGFTENSLYWSEMLALKEQLSEGKKYQGLRAVS